MRLARSNFSEEERATLNALRAVEMGRPIRETVLDTAEPGGTAAIGESATDGRDEDRRAKRQKMEADTQAMAPPTVPAAMRRFPGESGSGRSRGRYGNAQARGFGRGSHSRGRGQFTPSTATAYPQAPIHHAATRTFG